MQQMIDKTRRGFSPAAREAAKAARLRNAELKSRTDEIEVFVIRAGAAIGFRWEIRKFGGVVLERSIDIFATPGGARRAGEAALGSA